MDINKTYLKNNGLYQKKFRKLITSNNQHLLNALELYNLFHGSTKANKMAIEADPIFRFYARTLEHFNIHKYLANHTVASYESLIDFIVCLEYTKL